MLQSTAFTKLPPIEPGLSAKEFMSSGRFPGRGTARIDAFAAASPQRAANYGAADGDLPRALARESIDLSDEYARAMTSAAPVGAQYQARGLSTDTIDRCELRRVPVAGGASPARARTGRFALC